MRPDELEPTPEAPGLARSGYVEAVDLAWRWLVGGVVAIAIGLTVWWTAFVLIPVSVVLLVIGMTKSVRSSFRASSM